MRGLDLLIPPVLRPAGNCSKEIRVRQRQDGLNVVEVRYSYDICCLAEIAHPSHQDLSEHRGSNAKSPVLSRASFGRTTWHVPFSRAQNHEYSPELHGFFDTRKKQPFKYIPGRENHIWTPALYMEQKPGRQKAFLARAVEF